MTGSNLQSRLDLLTRFAGILTADKLVKRGWNLKTPPCRLREPNLAERLLNRWTRVHAARGLASRC